MLDTEFGTPTEIDAKAVHPHCLDVSWKKAAGHVTGYRVYCYSTDSTKADIISDVHDKDTESLTVTGLNPDTNYRVGVASLSSDTESYTVFMKKLCKMRKLVNCYEIVSACRQVNNL